MMNDFDIITSSTNSKFKLVLKAMLVGITASFVTILYRYALAYAEKYSFIFYNFERNNKWSIPFSFILLAITGWFVGKLIEKEPFSSGSGIPNVKGVMEGYLTNRPISVIIYKFLGGTLSIISGLSLGREGPSVQLGACTGDFLSEKFKSSKLERKLLLSSGTSAGLAAAFNAPLSGVLFSLEELYKYFSPLVLLSTITAAVVSDFIAKEFFGLQPVFHFGKCVSIPLNNYWILIILGIVLGLSGVFYNWCTLKSQKLYAKIKLKTPFKMIIPFLLAGILGLIFPVVLCGGHAVIDNLTLNSTLSLLILILIGKFLFSIISFGSGAPGGIFFPLLIIGGSIGAVFGYLAINYLGVNPSFFNNFIIISMAGYFTAIVRAPITGVVLITEMTSSLNHLLSLTLVSIVSYIVAEAFKSKPIYDSLLDSLLKKNNINEYYDNKKNKKIIITNTIHFGSQAENAMLKCITFPPNALIVSINRGEYSLVPKGDTVLKAGDELLTMTDLSNEWKVRESLNILTTIE